jgi:hypothetical protein
MPEAKFRKGELVRFRLGTRSAQGEIKEDRGPIGVKGRHLYLVEFRPEPQPGAPALIELPSDELQSVKDTAMMER